MYGSFCSVCLLHSKERNNQTEEGGIQRSFQYVSPATGRALTHVKLEMMWTEAKVSSPMLPAPTVSDLPTDGFKWTAESTRCLGGLSSRVFHGPNSRHSSNMILLESCASVYFVLWVLGVGERHQHLRPTVHIHCMFYPCPDRRDCSNASLNNMDIFKEEMHLRWFHPHVIIHSVSCRCRQLPHTSSYHQ